MVRYEVFLRGACFVYECIKAAVITFLIISPKKIQDRSPDTVSLTVDKPEVEAETEVVYGGVGRPAVLGCRVYSAPEAEVKWYRGTMLIEPDNYRYEAVVSTASLRPRSSGTEAPFS